MKQRRCMGRSHPPHVDRFYDAKLGPCPECGDHPSGFSSHMHTAKLNGVLYDQAERALKPPQATKEQVKRVKELL